MTRFHLHADHPGRASVLANALSFLSRLPSSQSWEIVISELEELRTLDQNAKMWAMLADVSEQVEWYGKRLEPHEWKDVYTAALKRNKVVPGLDGGFVVVGASTSRMSKKTMAELIELIYAFGSERHVRWTDPNDDAAIQGDHDAKS